MAKTSMIVRDKKRRRLSNRLEVRKARFELKKIISHQNTAYEEKHAAVNKLNERKRNESAIRHQRRCAFCGRPRGVYRKFGLCRIHIREAAMRGDIPGLMKASW